MHNKKQAKNPSQSQKGANQALMTDSAGVCMLGVCTVCVCVVGVCGCFRFYFGGARRVQKSGACHAYLNQFFCLGQTMPKALARTKPSQNCRSPCRIHIYFIIHVRVIVPFGLEWKNTSTTLFLHCALLCCSILFIISLFMP